MAGLEAGADDYLGEPVNLSELWARLHVGVRVVTLQERLANKVTELQATRASATTRTAGSASRCLSPGTRAKFTHGICPTWLEAAQAEFAREDSLLNEPPRVR